MSEEKKTRSLLIESLDAGSLPLTITTGVGCHKTETLRGSVYVR